MAETLTVLVTAFEPSGDALAAGLIAALRQQSVEVRVVGLGGPQMAAAGAELLETTTEHAVMLGGAVGEVWAHKQRLARLKAYLREHRIDVLVPVDSAAANWSICQLVRDTQPQAKIIHLVLPQIWAWAGWRIHKLRRLTDHVLCILPFEPDWLRERGVPGTFVGHPLFDPDSGAQTRVTEAAGAFPDGEAHSRLAVLPGSRPGVIRANLPTMLGAAERLAREHPNLRAVVAASSETSRRIIDGVIAGTHGQSTAGQATPGGTSGGRGAQNTAGQASRGTHNAAAPGLSVWEGQVDDVLAWADAVLVNSGTASLHVAAHGKPMVVMYNVSRLTWHGLGRWLVRTRTFALPNVIAEAAGHGRIVPELVPHFGAVEPVAHAVERVLMDSAARDQQREALAWLRGQFADRRFGPTAAQVLLKVVKG